MCGIAGAISPDPADLVRIRQAAAQLRHRGPDANSGWTDGQHQVAFGHTRLCIIDLSEQAAQPFFYGNRYVMVYNGELYNYRELKTLLEQRGCAFQSTSDTEVVVAAYASFGKECLRYFDGMFAFAIWDQQEQLLFAARDRFGEKPFYFYHENGKFFFASEMKTLWQAGILKEPNAALLYNFLTIGYTGNPGDPMETFYRDIHKLPAAHCLELRMPGNTLMLERYWQLEMGTYTGNDPKEQLQHLLLQSVQKRLRSDVAIGTSLSGGLDSASIVALCAQQSAAQYTHKCFTAQFPGFEKDETAYAAQVAQQFGLQHFVVPVHENDLVACMDQLMYHQEEPVTSASVLPQYKVYEAARKEGVTVLLDGQGADEVLGGYHKYYRFFWQQLYRRRELGKSKELMRARVHGVSEAFGLPHKMAALLPEFAAALWQSRRARAAFHNPYLNRDFAAAQKAHFYFSLPATPDLKGALYFNTAVYGLEELLRYADRNSMASSVEVRLPFLQHELVTFLFSLPDHYKIQEGWTKWILRKCMEESLPKNIVWRKDKVGFEPPQKKWMEHKAIREQVHAAKSLLVKEGILAPKAVQSYRPADAYAADNRDWRFWTASYLFRH